MDGCFRRRDIVAEARNRTPFSRGDVAYSPFHRAAARLWRCSIFHLHSPDTGMQEHTVYSRNTGSYCSCLAGSRTDLFHAAQKPQRHLSPPHPLLPACCVTYVCPYLRVGPACTSPKQRREPLPEKQYRM